MSGERHDWQEDPLAALREELSAVRPSPAFAARVRERVDADAVSRRPESPLRSWLAAWRWAVPVGALVVVGIFTMRQDPRPVTDAGQVATAIAPSPDVRPPAPPATAPVVRSGRPAPVEVARRPQPRVDTVAAAPRGPMLEVITNQPELLRRLWADVRLDRTSVLLAGDVTPGDAGEIVVAAIAVEPVVVKWMVEPPQPAGAGGAVPPVIRRFAALAVERSFQ